MRVVFCAYDRENYVGGPNAWLRRLLPDLRSQGIDAQCYMMTASDPDVCPSLAALRRAGVPVRHTPYHRFVEERIHWLLSCARTDLPDVFVPNLVPAAYHAARWLRQAGTATVGVLHSDDRFYQDISRLFVFGRPEDRVDAMVCVSELLKDSLDGAEIGEAIHIGPSIDITEAEKPASGMPLRLMYAGRLVDRQKRIGRVARMFCLAANRFPDVEAAIYGFGPDLGLMQDVLATTEGGDRVTFGGRIDSDRIVTEMAKHHVAVLLSEYEGLPLSLLEAMGQGLVPLCSRKCRSGIPEVVRHGHNGLLIGEKEKDFLDAVNSLREDTSLRSRLSANARKTVKANFSMEATSSQWIGLFQRVVDRRACGKSRVRTPLRLALPSDAVHSEDDRGGFGASLKGFINQMTGRALQPAASSK